MWRALPVLRSLLCLGCLVARSRACGEAARQRAGRRRLRSPAAAAGERPPPACSSAKTHAAAGVLAAVIQVCATSNSHAHAAALILPPSVCVHSSSPTPSACLFAPWRAGAGHPDENGPAEPSPSGSGQHVGHHCPHRRTADTPAAVLASALRAVACAPCGGHPPALVLHV